MDFSQVKQIVSSSLGEIIKITNLQGITLWEKIKELIFMGYPLTITGIPTATTLDNYKFYGNSVQGDLPSGYTQLSYVESENVNVDLGFTPTINSKIRFKFSPINKNGTGYAGFRNDPLRFSCTTFSSGDYFAFNMNDNSWSNNKTLVEIGKVYDCIAYNGKQIINGTEYDEPVYASFDVSSTFKLGAVSSSGVVVEHEITSERIYIVQHWENDVLKNNILPCKRNSDNVVGLYDTVTNTFYVNLNTYSFTAGDVAPTPETPIEVKSVGDKTDNYLPASIREDLPKIMTNNGDGTYTINGTVTANTTFNLFTDTEDLVLPVGNVYLYYNYTGDVKPIYSMYLKRNNNDWQPFRDYETNAVTLSDTDEYYNHYYVYGLIAPGTYNNVIFRPFIKTEQQYSYEPYGYKVPVEVEAENYWTGKYNISTGGGVTIDVKDDGTVYASGTCTTSNNFIIQRVTLEAGTYTLTSNTNRKPFDGNTQAFIQIYSGTVKINYLISNSDDTKKQLTFELPYSTDYQLRFRVQQDVNYDGLIFRPVLQKGESIQSTTTNVYLSEPLRKVDDYADYIDYENQQVVRNVGILGTEKLANKFLSDGNASSVYIGSQYITLFSPIIGEQTDLIEYNFGGYISSERHNFKVLSNCLVPLNTSFLPSTYKYGMTGVDGSLNLYLGTTAPLGRSEMAQRIRDINLELILPLTTPTTEAITLPSLTVADGTTIIETDTTIKPTDAYAKLTIGG